MKLPKRHWTEQNRNWIGQRPDFQRASHLCICEKCGKEYIDHPLDYQELDFTGQPYLNILCSGERVKL
jgi:DNA primase large subunit